MQVLTVTNFHPDPATPQRGRWVADQVDAIRERGIEVELFSFPPGRANYLPAARAIRGRLRERRFDLVHAHYGLAGWSARLAGARPLLVTFHGTDVRHRLAGPLSRRLAKQVDLAAGVSKALFAPEAGRPGLPRSPGRNAVLPCGADPGRFGHRDRRRARKQLGLDPERPFLFFPADPARPEKRHDRAAGLAARLGAELHSGGGIAPELMPLWLNAANAVLVTSENEGFGLAALESLACGVPVLSTPVGIAPFALAALEGCLVAPFDQASWAAVAEKHLGTPDPRVAGAARAEEFSAGRMAERVIEVYRHLVSLD